MPEAERHQERHQERRRVKAGSAVAADRWNRGRTWAQLVDRRCLDASQQAQAYSHKAACRDCLLLAARHHFYAATGTGDYEVHDCKSPRISFTGSTPLNTSRFGHSRTLFVQ